MDILFDQCVIQIKSDFLEKSKCFFTFNNQGHSQASLFEYYLTCKAQDNVGTHVQKKRHKTGFFTRIDCEEASQYRTYFFAMRQLHCRTSKKTQTFLSSCVLSVAADLVRIVHIIVQMRVFLTYIVFGDV